jgi:hypothetical protein
MRKKIFVEFVLFFILTLLNAYGEEHELIINSSEVQLGDRYPGLSTTWNKSFEIPEKPFSAELSIERKDIDNCTIPVFLNDISIGSLPLDSGSYRYTINTLPIPQGILLQGTNSIRIAARDCAFDEYDDIFFRRIELKYETGYRWTNENGGNWQDVDNWDQNELPSEDAITLFDLPNTYTVSSYNSTINSMNIVDGIVLFESGTSLILKGVNSSLMVDGGKLFWLDGSLETTKAVVGINKQGSMSIGDGGWWFNTSEIKIGANAKGVLNINNQEVRSPTIIVGSENEGRLNLSEGGVFYADDVHIGWSDGGRGYVSITSKGILSVSNLISIGAFGYGILTVEDNESLVNANNILVGGINFSLLVVKSGGKVQVNRNINIRPGGGIINEGVLKAAQINVEAGGYLISSGTVTANAVVQDQGAMVIGLSPGTLTIDGNYLQQSGGILEIEISGMTPDSEHDLLQITGNATLGGTLKLFFADGFAPQGGNPSTENDTFAFMTVDGTLSGSFEEVIVKGLEEGFQYDITSEGGVVKLTALSNGVPVCIDEDGDGYPRYAISSCPNANEADCNDTNPDVNPGAEEIPNAIDDNCDGNIDGLEDTTTTVPEGCPPGYTDCGNGYCCPPETPVCGQGEDEGLCFEKKGCPVTAIYGKHSEEVELLRNVRDGILINTREGQELIKLYYQWSPVIVKAMEADEEFKQEIKGMIDGIIPMLFP